MKHFLLILLAATSCTTFSDLESEHPYRSRCNTGFVANDDGECVRATNNVNNTANNESNTPNNVSNAPNNLNNLPCEAEPGTCCQTADGIEFCCTAEDCCSTDPDECPQPPPNNTNPNPILDTYMLVIADADAQSCADAGGDGPDIFGVAIELDGVEAFPYVVMFQPGDNTQGADDVVAAVIEQFDHDAAQQCPDGASFSLGCGGWVGIGIETNEAFDLAAGARLTILESGPECDQAGDIYSVLVCPINDPNIDADDCYPVVEAFEGTFDQDVELL